jgi:hypothetical protein
MNISTISNGQSIKEYYMKTFSLHFDLDLLNEYFHFFRTKEEIQEFAKIEKNGALNTYAFLEQHYIFQHLRLSNAIENFNVEVDLEKYKTLIDKYGLENHHDAILFAVSKFKETYVQSPSFRKELEDSEALRRFRLECYTALKFILIIRERNEPVKLQIRVDKNNKFVLEDQTLINGFLDAAFPYFAKSVLNSETYNLWGNAENLIMREILEDGIEINQAPKRNSSQIPGGNDRIASFCEKCLHYLNNETNLKVDPNVEIANRQVAFLYELLCLFGILFERHGDTTKYLTAIIKNAQNKVNKAE